MIHLSEKIASEFLAQLSSKVVERENRVELIAPLYAELRP
jgi:hypothetical protein